MNTSEYVSDATSIDNNEPLFIRADAKDKFFETAYTLCTERKQVIRCDPRKENLWPYYFATDLAQADACHAKRQAKRRRRAAYGQPGVEYVLVLHEPDELHRYLLSYNLQPIVVNLEQLQAPDFEEYQGEGYIAGEVPLSPNEAVEADYNDGELAGEGPLSHGDTVEADYNDLAGEAFLPFDDTVQYPEPDDILPSIETNDQPPVVILDEETSPILEDVHPVSPAEAQSSQSTISDENYREVSSAPLAGPHVSEVPEASHRARATSPCYEVDEEEFEQEFGQNPFGQESSHNAGALSPCYEVNEEEFEQEFGPNSFGQESAIPNFDENAKSAAKEPDVVQNTKPRHQTLYQQPPAGYFQPVRRTGSISSVQPQPPQSKPFQSYLYSETPYVPGHNILQHQPIPSFAPPQDPAVHTAFQPTGLIHLCKPFEPQPIPTNLMPSPNRTSLIPRPTNAHLAPHLLDRPSAAASAKMQNTAPTSKGNGGTRGDQETWSEAERHLLHRAAAQWWHWKDNNTLPRGASSGAALYRYFEFVFAEAGLSRSYYQLKNQWSRNERAKFGRSEQRDKKDGTARNLVTSARPTAKAKVEAELAQTQSNKRKKVHKLIADGDEDDEDDDQDTYSYQPKSARHF